ncbi:protein kinase domain-containing protein [Micromonospora sp. DT41]|uniref:protein kinase domain-containing protein n=1 Tax=Micromonospora sp. DT41 TaxID=3393437 RepID=UPI003CF8376F
MNGTQQGDLEGAPSLIARYGKLVSDDHSESERETLLQGILSDLLTQAGFHSRPRQLLGTIPTLGLRRGDAKVQLGLAWRDAPLTARNVAAWQQAASGNKDIQGALLSLSGFDADAASGLSSDGRTVVLLDRQHAEAALCGLMTIDELIAEAGDRAAFDNVAFTPLTELLVRPYTREPAPLLSHTRRPMPWKLDIQTAAGVSLQHLLSAEAGWDEITGFAVHGPSMLLTTDQGVIEVDRLRGTAHWRLSLAGCSGNVLTLADDEFLVQRGAAVIRWKDGVIAPVAGDLNDARMLLRGPGGQPWALCGNGADLAGTTLGLVQLGDEVGAQQRYSISFNADVLSAVWLGELRFLLAAEGHSAVLDLGRTTMVRREDWFVSPPSPRFLVANGQEVITAGTDRSGTRGFVHRVDTTRGTTDLIAEVQLNRIQGMALTAQGRLLLVGDVRGNNQLPHPVIIQASLPAAILTTPDADRTATPDDQAAAPPYRAVRAAARGVRKDYALKGQPLKSGGQAHVFLGTHKSTGVPIALKKLRMMGVDQRARLRREVDVAGMFGSNKHVMPVLDFCPAYEWFIMPLATHSAEDVAADLRDEGALRKLITAICEGLREAHQIGWTHRDLKPANILWLDERWVVADWGLGRRPRGRTTAPGLTRTGGLFGSEGYAAPELYTDAHGAGPQADIYSIGQIIGWALLQTEPRANVPHLPPEGPWRTVVETSTHIDPQLRPNSVDELLAIIAAELDSPTADAGQDQHQHERGDGPDSDETTDQIEAGPRTLPEPKPAEQELESSTELPPRTTPGGQGTTALLPDARASAAAGSEIALPGPGEWTAIAEQLSRSQILLDKRERESALAERRELVERTDELIASGIKARAASTAEELTAAAAGFLEASVGTVSKDLADIMAVGTVIQHFDGLEGNSGPLRCHYATLRVLAHDESPGVGLMAFLRHDDKGALWFYRVPVLTPQGGGRYIFAATMSNFALQYGPVPLGESAHNTVEALAGETGDIALRLFARAMTVLRHDGRLDDPVNWHERILDTRASAPVEVTSMLD